MQHYCLSAEISGLQVRVLPGSPLLSFDQKVCNHPMPFQKPLELIAQADLELLITDAVAERAVIEYKSRLPGNSDGDKKEFLSDVSSFANALGGHLIYGMDEAAGLPTGLSGVQVPDANSEKLRFENMIRTGIAPEYPAYKSENRFD
jgi:hypothetical protein